MPGQVEIVRSIYEHFAETGELAWHHVADDFVFDATDALPDVKEPLGRKDAEPLFRSYSQMFDSYEITLEEVLLANEDKVVTAVVDGGVIKGSETAIRNRFFHVWTFSGEKVSRWSSHTERAQALEASGLV